MTAALWKAAAVVAALVGVFWLGKCSDRGEGEDAVQNRYADSLRAAAIDSMAEIRVRDSIRADYQAREKELIQRERDEARSREVRMATLLARITRLPGGGAELAPDTVGDTVEVIGPRTLFRIDSLTSDIAQLRGIVRRDSLYQDSLHVALIDLRSAVRRATDALVESEKEVTRLKSRKAGGWRDRIRPRIVVGPGANLTSEKEVKVSYLQVTAGWQVFP